MDEPRYLLGQVASAAGISANLLKSWIDREIVVLGKHDRGAYGKGSSRIFTLRRVLEVAITAELANMGVSATSAYVCGVGVMASFDIRADALSIRGLFAVKPGSRHEAFEIAPTATVAEVLGPPFAPSVILVDMKDITARVLTRLGELPASVRELPANLKKSDRATATRSTGKRLPVALPIFGSVRDED